MKILCRLLLSLALTGGAALPLLAASFASFGGEILSFDGQTMPAPAAPAPSGSAASGYKNRAAATAAPALPLAPKKYTVLLYMNGKNSLAPYVARKLMELEAIGSDNNINIVAAVGLLKLTPARSSGDPRYPYNVGWEGTRRFYVQPNPRQPAKGVSTSYRLTAPENEDMGDYRNLAAFITWGKTNFPAQKTILVVSSHGYGWADTKKPEPAASSSKGISYDDVTRNYITTPQIGLALREAGGADVLIMDDCLMQAAEVASEIGTSVKYIVGSEETGWSNHFRPDKLFAGLKADPDMPAADFVAGYMKAFSEFTASVWTATKKTPSTMSALDTSKTAGLELLLKEYAVAARAALRKGYVARSGYRKAIAKVTRYKMPLMADLYHFIDISQAEMGARIKATPADATPEVAELDRLSTEIKDYISGELVLANSTTGWTKTADYSKSRGVSIYIPAITPGEETFLSPTYRVASDQLETPYKDLAFDKATGWGLFAAEMFTRPKN